MCSDQKEMLLALIDGLSKTKNSTQYSEGEKYLDEKAIRILKNTIKNL